MGCIFYELIMNEYLFNVDKNLSNIQKDRNHLYQMYQYFGKIPFNMIDECERTYELFDNKGRVIKNKKVDYINLNETLTEKRSDLSENEINSMVSFLKYMLTYDPCQRPTASECLQHPFFN